MNLNDLEIKCWEYIYLIKDIEKLPKGLYTLDKLRTDLHDLICKRFKLNKEITKKYTDHLDKYDYNGTELYLALLEESRKNKEDQDDGR